MWPTVFSYLECRPDGDDANVCVVGGKVARFTSGAALNVGDVVYLSAANTVNKSTTSANYAGFVGVVVGGYSTGMRIPPETNVASIAATSGSGQDVLVQIDGIAWVVAEGTITAGTNFSVICTATTAGRVIAGTTAGQMLGTALTTGSSGNFFKMLIRHR